MTGLIFGPLPSDTIVVCIDMQRIFLEPGDWFCGDGLKILPAIRTLVSRCPGDSLFTRFMSAPHADKASGAWQRFYQHWDSVTVDRVGLDKFALHAELAPLATPERLFDKTTYDAFLTPRFDEYLKTKHPATLVFCGVETDVCVLASVLTAVDLGHRVVLAEDALASSDMPSHDAILRLMRTRLDRQVEVAPTDAIVSHW